MTLNLNELARGGTMCFSKAGLAIGGTASKAKIAAPNGAGVDYAINGIMYHKADTDDCVLFTGLTQSDATTCLYLVCLDSSGTVSVVQGTEVLTASLTAGTAVLEWPTPTANTCPIGAIKLVLTGAFTGATTELSAATVTDTYYDLCCVPVSPLTS
jgi:hypothetical protein